MLSRDAEHPLACVARPADGWALCLVGVWCGLRSCGALYLFAVSQYIAATLAKPQGLKP